jgi:hypothetical protein
MGAYVDQTVLLRTHIVVLVKVDLLYICQRHSQILRLQ